VFFTITDRANLVSTMQKYMSVSIGHFLEDEAVGETAQWERRQVEQSDRDEKQQRRDPLPFVGDNLAEPPLVWTLVWDGTYINLYGSYVQDCIRRWGYVMWEATRIEGTGARELLMRQWKEDWGDIDPRDKLL
jgi:hypothetical protein